MSEPVDFLRVPMPDGGSRTLLTRFTDGSVLCCICWERCRVEDLNQVEGGVEDVCKRCAADEMRALAARAGEAP